MGDYLEPLIVACRNALDDDAPRLVWGDAVGEERGELVAIQCELAQGDLSGERCAALRRRQDQLIRLHGHAWSNLKGIARRCVFGRGFVDAVEVEEVRPTTLFELLGRAPLVTSLTASQLRLADVDVLLAQDELSELRGLALVEDRTGELHLDTPLIERLVDAAPRLRQLHAFGLHAAIGERGIERLVESDLLANVERLSLRYVDLTAESARLLFAHMPKLRALELGYGGNDVTRTLPPLLVELSMWIDEVALEAIAAGPLGQTLERLCIEGLSSERVELFGQFSRLRALDLGKCQLGLARNPPSHWRTNLAFAEVAMPSLRELSMSPYTKGEELPQLVRTLGAHLELLHLGDLGDADVGALRAGVAGELMVQSYPEWSKAILRAGVDTRAPWLDKGFVDFGHNWRGAS